MFNSIIPLSTRANKNQRFALMSHEPPLTFVEESLDVETRFILDK
jgi:hypothetical protein